MGIKNIRYGLANIFRDEKYKVIVNMTRLGDGSLRLSRDIRVTAQPESVLILNGYKKAVRLLDSVTYANMPAYVKLIDFKEYQLTEKDPKDTASTLHDFYRSNSIEKYKKGLTKANKIGQMDLKLIGIMVVVIAIAGGFILLFGGSF